MWEHLNYLKGLLSKAFPCLRWTPYSVNERQTTTPLKVFIFVLDLDIYHSSLTNSPAFIFSMKWSSAYRGSSVDQEFQMIRNITKPSRNKGYEREWEVAASSLNSVLDDYLKFDIGIQITQRTCGLMLEGRWYKQTPQKGYIYQSTLHFFVILWFCNFFWHARDHSSII